MKNKEDKIPFTPLRKPLYQCKVALITTGGIHLSAQEPFDMDNLEGDASFREIPNGVDSNQIVITHKYYNHSDADKDLNVIFPLHHFRELEGKEIIGSLAPSHYGFMGHINGEQLTKLFTQTAPEVAKRLKQEEVDVAFLTPA